MGRPHAKVRAVSNDPRKCKCGCGQRLHNRKRTYLPSHSQFINPRMWTGDGRSKEVGPDKERIIDRMVGRSRTRGGKQFNSRRAPRRQGASHGI